MDSEGRVEARGQARDRQHSTRSGWRVMDGTVCRMGIMDSLENAGWDGVRLMNRTFQASQSGNWRTEDSSPSHSMVSTGSPSL